MKYLQSEDRTEQRGRAEDGPVGYKHKWTDWPHQTPGAELLNGSKKVVKKTTKTASAKTTTSQQGTKK